MALHLVCPLEFERSRLRAAAAQGGWVLHCSGPGRGGIERWAAASGLPRGSRVVLAGVAGSLVAEVACGECVEAIEVCSEDGSWRVPRLVGCGRAVRLLCADAVVGTARSRTAAAAAHGAEVVDLESAHFAREAEARGWTWSVVRGISDGPHDDLPRGVERWTDDGGRTRFGRVVGHAAVRPWRARALLRLGRRSAAAMDAVARAMRAAGHLPPDSGGMVGP